MLLTSINFSKCLIRFLNRQIYWPLNASIKKAARAGELGKGFAVVADEVRKLAEDTNQTTSQIQTMIQNIEKETESTVLIMAQMIGISNG
ncbi:hypothetical protein WQ54_29295 [Bacillus sp. SA1-12]|nr:hypothetical protein WQ54_29295 [Bacillus sp. SA1-12]